MNTAREEQSGFLLALHFALLPHEAPPVSELAQVLAGTSSSN